MIDALKEQAAISPAPLARKVALDDRFGLIIYDRRFGKWPVSKLLQTFDRNLAKGGRVLLLDTQHFSYQSYALAAGEDYELDEVIEWRQSNLRSLAVLALGRSGDPRFTYPSELIDFCIGETAEIAELLLRRYAKLRSPVLVACSNPEIAAIAYKAGYRAVMGNG
jgi:hypothetical protein